MTRIVSDSGTALTEGGTTTYQGLRSQALLLSGVSDLITFPNVDPLTEAVRIASVDVRREDSGLVPSVTFFGTTAARRWSIPILAATHRLER